MRPIGLLMLSVGLVLGGAAACSDDDGPGDNNNTVDQQDAAVGQDAEVQQDAAPPPYVQGCTGDPVTTPSGLGACCDDDTDCPGGYCSFFKWCSQHCTSNADCGVAVDGPFPTGTQFVCNVHDAAGLASWCVPGSAQHCGRESDPPCPDGESCVMAFSDISTSLSDRLIGMCITSFTAPGTVETGGRCDDSDHPYPYQCSAPNFYSAGCQGRRCTEACDPANPTNTCPTGMFCYENSAMRTSEGVYSGVGFCSGAECGRLEFSGDAEADVRLPGLNSDCTTNEICQTYNWFGIDGEKILGFCIPSYPSLGQAGDACEKADKFDQGCDMAGLCLQEDPVYDPAGDVCTADEDCSADQVCVKHPSLSMRRCAAKPAPGVCSVPCRSGADCPDLEGQPSICIRSNVRMLNGLDGYETYCQPWRFISDEIQVFCDESSGCLTDFGALCRQISLQDSRRACLWTLTQDAAGSDCQANGAADCQANEACVEDDSDGSFRCTPYLTAGTSCDPTGIQCMGDCLDIEGQIDDNGTPTNTYCVDQCWRNADCGANAVCDLVVTAANDSTIHTDDVLVTTCRTMMVRSGPGCTVPGDCSNGDACEPATGRCYTTAAAWGDGCTQHSDCPQNGLCDTKVPGGLCYRPGCNPAAGNTGCDNAGACSDFFPVGLCLESCTNTPDCSRNAEGFTCENGACVQPPYVLTDR